ncbi:MAG: (4Fe-4S)-binding protein [Bacteroidia bacterium]
MKLHDFFVNLCVRKNFTIFEVKTMAEIIKEYTNGEVTIVWKPEMCQHSAKCFKGLPSVFNPRIKPWIDAEGANTEAIVTQILNCPSKALSFFYNSDKSE